jgi:hypothetical protein
MSRRKSYNPNSRAGRRNYRNQYYENYAKKSPEEKAKHDSDVAVIRFFLFIIFMIICIIVVALGGKIR